MVPTLLLVLVAILIMGSLAYGIAALLAGADPGMGEAEPDTRAVPLPDERYLEEADLRSVSFDVGWRGYRMDQVDRALRRIAYDIGYKNEMIAVLELEVAALREGRLDDARQLAAARGVAPTMDASSDTDHTPRDRPAAEPGEVDLADYLDPDPAQAAQRRGRA